MTEEGDPLARVIENAADRQPYTNPSADSTYDQHAGGGSSLAFSHPSGGAMGGTAAVFPITGMNAPTAQTLDFYNAPAGGSGMGGYGSGPSVGGGGNIAWMPPQATYPQQMVGGVAPAFQSPFAPPPMAQPIQGTPSASPAGSAPAVASTRAFWTIQFWQQFFNVDTNDVKERIMCSLLFLKEPPYLSQKKYSYAAYEAGAGMVNAGGQLSSQDGNTDADLYGPLWICATLWVVMAVVAHTTRTFNCGTSSQADECTTSWFTPVVAACGVIFGYEFIVPFALWLFMKWKDVPVSLVDTMCLYGYSFFVFIPTAVVCAIPYAAVQWTAIAIAWAISTAHIIWNLYGVWKQTLVKKWFTIIVISAMLLQLGLCAAFKFEFFASLKK